MTDLEGVAGVLNYDDWCLPETRYIDLSVNDVSIGEFGQLALCANELDVPAIFFSGDSAGCLEAQHLTPGIETVSVKRGTMATSGYDLDAALYLRHNAGAVHRHPEQARILIREGAERALRRFASRRLRVTPPPAAPYKRVAIFRGEKGGSRAISVESHSESVIELMNMPFHPTPLVE
jgi:hypothetical protein